MEKMISDEDFTIVRESVLHDLLLTKLEKDKVLLQQSSIKVIRPYLSLVNQTMDKISKDKVSIHQTLRKRGIKIHEFVQTPHLLKVPFLCRGRHDEMVMNWELIRAELEVLLNHYFLHPK